MRDASEIFQWAKERGDANVIDRIIVKILPSLLANNITLSSSMIENAQQIMVSDGLYEMINETAKNLIDSDINGGSCRV